MKSFHLYLYGPEKSAIDCRFDDAEKRLNQLALLHFEPDGSFVWIREEGRQQIYGMLYDAKGQIQYGELQGKCERETWRNLIDAIRGDSAQNLIVMQLPDRQLQNLQTFETESWG